MREPLFPGRRGRGAALPRASLFPPFQGGLFYNNKAPHLRIRMGPEVSGGSLLFGSRTHRGGGTARHRYTNLKKAVMSRRLKHAKK